jgi:hypothetical protein
VAEIQGDRKLGVEGIEQKPEEAVVPGLGHLDPHRAEGVAQLAGALRESVEASDAPKRGHLPAHRDGEAEAGRNRRRPALELSFRREAIEGVVQLDRRESLAVQAQELVRLRLRRIEAVLPARIREAGGAGV